MPVVDVYSGQFIVTNDIAAVELNMYVDGEHYSAVGVSKRHPTDKPNKELAKQLALSRALQQLSNKLARRANGMVEHQDNIRAEKEDKNLQYKKAIKKDTWLNKVPVQNINFNWDFLRI